jgi:hypothetical protein
LGRKKIPGVFAGVFLIFDLLVKHSRLTITTMPTIFFD